jgi:isoquinoline 1-oxidoreductase alpha subunit
MQASAMIAANPNPSEQQIAETMAGVICRCGCNQRIVAAVRQAATGA